MVYVHVSEATLAYLETLVETCEDDNACLEELRASIKATRAKKIRCCLNDGQPLSYPNAISFRLPNRQKRHGEYGFFNYTFCNVPCMKTYLETRNNFSPHLLVWLTIHAKRDLGIMDDIPTAPAPELLDVYRTDGGGISIEEYRNFNTSCKLTERIGHLPIDRALWKDEEQKNNPKQFFELIRGKEFLAERLFQEFVEAKKPVPKVAGETRAENKNFQQQQISDDSGAQEQPQQVFVEENNNNDDFVFVEENNNDDFDMDLEWTREIELQRKRNAKFQTLLDQCH